MRYHAIGAAVVSTLASLSLISTGYGMGGASTVEAKVQAQALRPNFSIATTRLARDDDPGEIAARPSRLALPNRGATPLSSVAKFPGYPPDSLPVSIVLVSGDLPRNALAIVQLRPRGLERIFIIFAESHVTDRLMMRAHGAATFYRIRHPEDKGNVEFWLFADGRLETHSTARGEEIGTHVPLKESVSGDEHMTKELLESIAAVSPSDFPGFGRARIIEWMKARQ